MTENDLIELYCIIDNFYQRFIMTTAGKKNLELYYGKHGPSRRMTVPEIMTLNIARILDRIADLKTFHKNAAVNYIEYFPNLTNYENFMKATNKATGFIQHKTKDYSLERIIFLKSFFCHFIKFSTFSFCFIKMRIFHLFPCQTRNFIFTCIFI